MQGPDWAWRDCGTWHKTAWDRMGKLHAPRGLGGILMEEDMRAFTKFMKQQEQATNM